MKHGISDVLEYAKEAHKGQERKYTGEPYIVHPTNVAMLLLDYAEDLTYEMKVAALLHDVVEDTEVTLEEITKEFGSSVSNLVYWLTDQSKPEDGNRAVRKAIDRHHISQAPDEAQLIKLADLIDNTESIVKHDKDFAKVYLKEKQLILAVLSDEVKTSLLYKEAEKILSEGLLELGGY